MVMFSKGGMTHTEVYNMPVHLRSFYYKRMVEIFEKSKEDADKATAPQSNRPDIPESVKKAIGKVKPKKKGEK